MRGRPRRFRLDREEESLGSGLELSLSLECAKDDKAQSITHRSAGGRRKTYNSRPAALSDEGSEPSVPFVFRASPCGRWLPADPALRRRPCLGLVVILRYLAAHAGEPPTGDWHPMNSRPCQAYTTGLTRRSGSAETLDSGRPHSYPIESNRCRDESPKEASYA